MEQEGKKYFKEKLFKEKKKVKNIKDKMANPQEAGFIDEYYTELSFYDNHPAEIGTEVFMMEQDKGFMDKLNNTLYEIDSSIEAIKEGNYGICTSCEKTIARERLELIPYVKLCIDCSREQPFFETKMSSIPKKEVKFNSFRENNNDDNNAFDREDSYQEVARHNRIENDPSQGTGDHLGVFDEDNSGTVEDIEEISNEYYDDSLK